MMTKEEIDMAKMSAEKLSQMDERQRLYNQGYTDAEIAGVQNAQITAVSQWRRKHGLPPNKREDESKEEAQTPAADAATECSRIFEKQMDKLEECRTAGMIVSDKPWDGEEPDPYAYDGSMTPEDFERRSELLRADREAEGRNRMTAATLMQILAHVPAGAVVTCAECGEGFEWAILRQEYDIHGNPGVAEIALGGER
jgi:hypothetical protein